MYLDIWSAAGGVTWESLESRGKVSLENLGRRDLGFYKQTSFTSSSACWQSMWQNLQPHPPATTGSSASIHHDSPGMIDCPLWMMNQNKFLCCFCQCALSQWWKTELILPRCPRGQDRLWHWTKVESVLNIKTPLVGKSAKHMCIESHPEEWRHRLQHGIVGLWTSPNLHSILFFLYLASALSKGLGSEIMALERNEDSLKKLIRVFQGKYL